MKKGHTFMLSAMATVALVTSPWLPTALAQQGTTGSSSGSTYHGTTGEGTGGQYGQSRTGQDQYGQSQTGQDHRGQSQRGQNQQDRIIASSFTAQVTGKVTSVDPQSGKLALDTPDGEVNVRFPPPAVAHVKTGDMVTVAVGLMEQNPSASPGMGSGSGMPSGSSHGPSSGGSSSGSSSTTR